MTFEDTLGKGKIDHNKQFLLFPVFSFRLEDFLPFSSNLKLLLNCCKIFLEKVNTPASTLTETSILYTDCHNHTQTDGVIPVYPEKICFVGVQLCGLCFDEMELYDAFHYICHPHTISGNPSHLTTNRTQG